MWVIKFAFTIFFTSPSKRFLFLHLHISVWRTVLALWQPLRPTRESLQWWSVNPVIDIEGLMPHSDRGIVPSFSHHPTWMLPPHLLERHLQNLKFVAKPTLLYSSTFCHYSSSERPGWIGNKITSLVSAFDTLSCALSFHVKLFSLFF